MDLDVKTAKVAGNPGSGSCSQSYDMESEDPSKRNTHGNLYLCISIRGAGEDNQSIFIIRGVAAQIQKKYYDNSGDSVIESLSSAVFSTVETYQKEIEISSVVILKGNAYIITYGVSEVILKRGSSLVVFRSPNGGIFKAVGRLQPEDVLVLATKNFVTEIPKNTLDEALRSKNPQQIVEYLAPTIQSNDNSSAMCASFIKVSGGIQIRSKIINDEYPEIKTTDNVKGSYVESETDTSEVFDDHEQGFVQKVIFKLRPKRLYIKDFQNEMENKRRRILSFSGIALLLLLAATVAFGLYSKKENERRETVQAMIEDIQKDLDEAEEVFAYSPQRSQELLNRSKEALEKMSDPSFKAEDETVLIQEKINRLEGSVLGLKTAEASDFLDLDLLSSGFVGDDIFVYNEMLYVSDHKNDRLLRINVSNKRSEVVAGKDSLDGFKGVAVWSNHVFVLKNDGIYDIKGSKILDSDWSSDTLIKSYSGNIYLLDKNNSRIIRYSVDKGDLVSRTSWLSGEVSADFSKIISWGIDGVIWLSSDSGSVFKYTYGYQQNFSLGKVAPELKSGALIYASSDNEFIYLLDKDNSRILAFDKEGIYKKQYSDEMISKATDFAVFEGEGKIILLTGDKLKQIEIK